MLVLHRGVLMILGKYVCSLYVYVVFMLLCIGLLYVFDDLGEVNYYVYYCYMYYHNHYNCYAY